jgi:hypothetical protein
LSWYDLESTSDDSYRVDAGTGEVVSAIYKHENRPNEPSDVPLGPRSKEDCLQIALNFARAKYQDFDAMGLTLLESDWVNGWAWMFEWGQKGAYDALLPNGCRIEVNPVDGKIIFYMGMHVGTVTPRPPQLTAAQALEVAKQAAGIVTVVRNEEPSLKADPTGGVFWTFTFGGTDANEEYREYAVTVDAETGEVLSLAQGVGIVAPPTRTPPRPRWLTIAIYSLPLVSGLVMTFGILRWRRWRQSGTKMMR